MFEVRERGTNKIIGTYKTRTMANKKKDNFDNTYGSYHYYIAEVIK